MGLDAEPRQIDTLLYCLGGEADSVLTSTNITAEDRKKYQEVIDKFDSHFKVRRNTIFERARFNRRCQKEGESSEQYITELYRLIEFCEYGDLKEEMLRDRLVVSIRDTALSDKLQTESDLMLEKAETLIRRKEAAKEHRRELQDNSRESTLGKIGSRQFQKRSTSGGGKLRSYKGVAQPQRIKESECSRCGRDKHQPGERCPAVGATCHSCTQERSL